MTYKTSSVNQDCITQFYPEIDPTDFILSPAGTDDDTDANTCKPFTGTEEDGKVYFYR